MNTSVYKRLRKVCSALAIVAAGVVVTGCGLPADAPLSSAPVDFRDADTLAWSLRISSDAVRFVECTPIDRLRYHCWETDDAGARRVVRVSVDPSGASWTAG